MTEPRVMKSDFTRESLSYGTDKPKVLTTPIFITDARMEDYGGPHANASESRSNFRSTVSFKDEGHRQFDGNSDFNLDSRSVWVSKLDMTIKTAALNVSEFYQSSHLTVRARTRPGQPAAPLDSDFEWMEIEMNEGTYSLNEIIETLNEQLFELWQRSGAAVNGVAYADFGVKIDTRDFSKAIHPTNNLVQTGTYLWKGVRPDIVLLPGAAVDFSDSRLFHAFGIQKRQRGGPKFIIDYGILKGGNIPALLDQKAFRNGNIAPVYRSAERTSTGVPTVPCDYHVTGDERAGFQLLYRSFNLAYNRKGEVRKDFVLSEPDVTMNLSHMCINLPDAFETPLSFNTADGSDSRLFHFMAPLPIEGIARYTRVSATEQKIVNSSMGSTWTAYLDPLPVNEIMRKPPPLVHDAYMVNRRQESQFQEQVLQNKMKTVQKVEIKDELKRHVPYVTKTLCVLNPIVKASRTLR